MASEIKRRFTDTEMQIAKETDLPELLTHLGYQVRRIGRYHTTAEMDSLRIKGPPQVVSILAEYRRGRHYLLQQFCGKSFSEAVEYLLAFHGRARDSPHQSGAFLSSGMRRKSPLPCRPGIRMTAGCLPTCASAASPHR